MGRKKLTPWFDADVKPARRGVYERRTVLPMREKFFSRWNGKFWCVGQFDIARAAKQTIRSGYQRQPWRGLMENPHA